MSVPRSSSVTRPYVVAGPVPLVGYSVLVSAAGTTSVGVSSSGLVGNTILTRPSIGGEFFRRILRCYLLSLWMRVATPRFGWFPLTGDHFLGLAPGMVVARDGLVFSPLSVELVLSVPDCPRWKFRRVRGPFFPKGERTHSWVVAIYEFSCLPGRSSHVH